MGLSHSCPGCLGSARLAEYDCASLVAFEFLLLSPSWKSERAEEFQ
jgi:hypothetical protein